MTETDKEKIEEAVRLLDELEKNVEKWKQGVESGYTKYRKKEYVEAVLDTTLLNFSRIKKLLGKVAPTDKEKIKKALSMVDELIELYELDDDDKEKVVELKEIKELLLVPSIDEAADYVAAVDSERADTGRDSYNEDLEELLDFLRS